MTKRSILSLASKVIGLVFLAHAVAAIPETVDYLMMFASMDPKNSGGPVPNTLLGIGGIVLRLAITVFLIGSSDWIARLLIREDREVALPDAGAQGRGILGLASRVVGIVLLALAIPGVVRLFSDSLIRVAIAAGGESRARDVVADAMLGLRAERWAELIGYGASIVIGLCLIFCARRLSAFLYPKPQDADQARLPNLE